MNLSAVNRSVVLLTRMFDPGRPTLPFLSMSKGKPVFSPQPLSLPHSAPEQQGVPSDHLAGFLRELREHPHLRMHSVLVLRHGRIICEADFGAQEHTYPRYTFSACKSIVSLAIGILCDQGKLRTDEKIVDLFSDRINAVSRLRLSALTVDHLLTMCSGIIFNELESQTDEDWIKCYLNSGLNTEPGQQIQYNSLNTYLLSAVVVRKSGMSLSDFLRKYLFDALDIRDFYWETCPRGVELGGWGLYMRPGDLAKLGQLLLQSGQWNGKQLISEEYCTRALSRQVRTPPSTGRYDYGYQIWVGESPRAFLFNGMFGQNVLAFPDTDMLIVSCGANDELFQQGPFYDIASAYLGDVTKLSEDALPPSPKAEARLRLETVLCANHTEEEVRTAALAVQTAGQNTAQTVGQPAGQKRPASRPASQNAAPRGLLSRVTDLLFGRDTAEQPADTRRTGAQPAQTPITEPLPPSAALFVGKTFAPKDGEPSAAVGLLPAVMQAVQSNYTQGFVSISFSQAVENGETRLLVTYRETDDTHIFTAGIHRAAKTVLYFHGVPFTAAAKASFPTDEDGRPVCRLQIDFPELPSSRIIKLFLNRDGTVLFRQEETPGAELISRTVIGWKTNLAMQPVIGGALDKIDNDYLSYRIRRTLAPELNLQKIQSE